MKISTIFILNNSIQHIECKLGNLLFYEKKSKNQFALGMLIYYKLKLCEELITEYNVLPFSFYTNLIIQKFILHLGEWQRVLDILVPIYRILSVFCIRLFFMLRRAFWTVFFFNITNYVWCWTPADPWPNVFIGQSFYFFHNLKTNNKLIINKDFIKLTYLAFVLVFQI